LSLTLGTRLGVYEITAPIGEGGMGQVFRARDTKLDRDVAIKILPEAFAHDADRLARFTREAKTLASLNHPCIAGIYGLEESGGVSALVMELVEGDDLSQRIARGAIPLDEALPIAKQIADALEAAHEQGIIHRDLKPANIKVRADGTVKVLDFGLAKAMEPAGTSSVNAMHSPTLSIHATMQGVILGTAAYMAPEQARGKAVDKRADIWAFGVVFYEMLTGRTAFSGETITDIIAAVVTREVDWAAIPATTPPTVRQLLARCLEKDPKRRLRDIGEARVTIDETLGGRNSVGTNAAAPATSSAHALTSARAARAWVPWTVAAVAVIGAVLTGITAWRSSGLRTVDAPYRAEIVPTPENAFARTPTLPSFTFTPDGRSLIYATTDPAARLLHRRDTDADTAVPIAGTEGAYGPFVSPDGAWVGFFADGKMKRVPVGGGAAQVIHDLRSPAAPDAQAVSYSNDVGRVREVGFGATWLTDDTIIYGRFVGGLWRVPAGGGTPTRVGEPVADGEFGHRLPHQLPGGHAILFTVTRNVLATAGSSVEALDLATGKRTLLVDDATDGRYAPGGYLLFARQGALYSVRFDPASLATSGDAAQLSDRVAHAVYGSSPGYASGAAQYDISSTGTLALLRGGVRDVSQTQLAWVSRGSIEPLSSSAAVFAPRLSPDGRRLAAMTLPFGVSTMDVDRGLATTLVKDGQFPLWMPDGANLIAAMNWGKAGKQDIYLVPLSGGAPVPLITSAYALWPSSVSTDGKWLAYVEANPVTGNDIWVAGISPKSTPVAVMHSAASEAYPAFSPDSKWLAYTSDEDGTDQIYVRPFPGPGRAERITRDGGFDPIWAPDGRSVFYAKRTNQQPQLMRVLVDTAGDGVKAGNAEVVAAGAFMFSAPVGGIDVAPDGRILATLNVPPAQAGGLSAQQPLHVVLHADLSGGKGRRSAPSR
jgi:hypothetical protein